MASLPRPQVAWLVQKNNRRRRAMASEPSFVVGDWTAGTNTTLSIAGGRARATRAGGNPRISQEVSELEVGATYRVVATGYVGTAGSMFFRVSADADLSAGDYVNVGGAGAINQTFVAPAGGTVYIGIVGVADTDGQYVEISEVLTITKE